MFFFFMLGSFFVVLATLGNNGKNLELFFNALTYPFKPQYPHTNSPNRSLYIFLKNVLREFDKISRHFLFGDRCINSHNLFS